MWLMVNNIILCLLITNSIIAENVGDECTPSSSTGDGTCTLVSDCPAAIRAIKNKRFHEFQRCGFDGFQEIVCCPLTTDKFGATETSPKVAQRITDRECKTILAGTIPPLDLHILGGEEASLGEFPHMVALGFDNGGGEYRFDCGGSLISNYYVLTAAHCIDTADREPPSVVRAGVVNIGGPAWDDETDYRVAETILHPNYTRREKYHDVALLRLDRPVQFSSTLNAVCLFSSNENPTSKLTITGWGRTSNTRDIKSTKLLKADVVVVPSDKCGESYTNWRKLPHGISQEMMCAGDPKGVRDTCQGDSGGPLQLMEKDGLYRLVGVTSFGRGCGSYVPGVYTRVSNYLGWIESIVWPN
ncbi:hypothetical protein O3G_MSEX001385 [Manduca sexta]|uniref:trypsin n=1 Tax=Manduca sexta TaxID=7130 RepID=A0A921YK97_MANSE|nr:hypothetical protein O3G_MSEX001385 [Manduca sexta]KAG6440699.1 hypothetical protein O3G_MSEX001385 [Manduca sexta]